MKLLLANARNGFRRIGYMLVLGVCLFAVSGQALATRTTTSVTLVAADTANASNQVIYVTQGELFSATVNATITNYSTTYRWRSTRITINGVNTCLNVTANSGSGYISNGSYSETLTNVAAPSAAGTYNVTATTYSATNCGTNAVAYTLTGAVVVSAAPVVSSIVRASSNPAATGASVSWTVTFSKAVTNVNASDFALVSSYGVSGASITSVSGSGTTWTVTANTGSGIGAGDLGLNALNDGSITDTNGRKLGNTYTGEVYMVSPPCSAPAGAPADVSCFCDNFNGTLDTNSWVASQSTTNFFPSVVNTGYLRMTANTGNNATAATILRAFPAAGNYISVEFRYFAYSGSDADGVAVTLSDYTVPAKPGAFGGSLGYAQKTKASGAVTTDVNGFAGGWIGVGIDEFGNYQNPTEGRIGGTTSRPQSVAVRGSGSAVAGYAYMAGTLANLSPAVSNGLSGTPAPGHRYQVIVDARNEPTSTAVEVKRDTNDGSGYASLFKLTNVYQGTTQARVPANWQLSFTGSTGSANNIHEISAVRVCASKFFPSSGGTASNFSVIDDAYGTSPGVQNFQSGHIYMKLVGNSFNLNVAALSNSQIQTGYVISGSKNVTLKVVKKGNFGDADYCEIDSSKATPSNPYCSAACTSKAAVTGGTGTTQTLAFVNADQGVKMSSSIMLNTAYSNLVAVVSDGTKTACSTDAFSVRPLSLSKPAITARNAGQTKFKAGSDPFTITVTSNGETGPASGYTGVPKVNNSVLAAVSPATVAGVISGVFLPATIGTPPSTATGTTFNYSEVGNFTLPGYPLTDTASQRGVYDGVHPATECGADSAACDLLKVSTWTGVDSISSKSDCIDGSYSNTEVTGSYAANPTTFGKYGCLFGSIAPSDSFGRFTPDHFALSKVKDGSNKDIEYITNRNELTCSPVSTFTYMDEPMLGRFTLTAQNASGGTTKNYVGAVATLGLTDTATNRVNMNLGALDSYSSSTPRLITGITKANPGVATTSVAHGYVTGDTVYINNIKGMIEANNRAYTVAVISPTSFSIGADTTAYTAYGAGGMAWKKNSNGIDLSARAVVDSLNGSWGSGTTAGVATDVQMVFHLARNAAGSPSQTVLDGPLMPEFGIAPTDADSVKISPYNMDIVSPTGNDHASLGLTQLLFGRIKLTNAHGSDRLALPIPMRAEYWNSSIGMFVTNVSDSCTKISSSNVTLLNRTGGVNLSNMTNANIVVGSGGTTAQPLANGIGRLSLSKPTAPIAKKGSVEVCVDLGTDASNVCATSPSVPVGQPWLQGKWRGSAVYNDDPWCRATFGVYKSEYIYFREIY